MTDPNENFSVGSRIRLLRLRKGLSLRSLAEISGLSSNAISLIERGENSPTVASLRHLAAALEVPIADFFQDAAEEMTVFVGHGQRAKSQAEGMLIESLASGLSLQHLGPFLVTIEPAAGSTAETYAHAGEEFIHCLEGAIEYRVGDRLYLMHPGDSLLFKAVQIHGFRNPTNAQSKALILIEEREIQDSEKAPQIHRVLHPAPDRSPQVLGSGS